MFEAAEIGNEVDKKTWSREAPKVREALLQIQRELGTTPLSVIIVVGGVEGAGKGETVNLLLEWMDARGIETHALDEPTDEERERPPGWRFWRMIPPKSRIGIFFGSWYTEPINEMVRRRAKSAEFDRELARINFTERMLTRENTLILKFWLHLSKSAQHKRFKSLEKDPLQRWRVTKQDWDHYRKYDRIRRISEHAIRRTSTADAPWHIVEAADPRYRALTVTKTIISSLTDRLAELRRRSKAKIKPDRPKPKPVNIIRQLDLTKKLSDRKYDRELAKYQARLNALSRSLRDEHRSMTLLFEGPDAAGKGGAIRRLTQAMDARQYQEISIAAPTDEELAHPYLWRFWRHLPRLGRITIYDRSWYGRVLVERLEGFAAPDDWKRAYEEINAFEEQLTDFGTILVKFWLAISPEEQLRRFKVREETPYKQYKITEEDWRNRSKWDAYEAAACDMIEKTSAETALWTLVEADDKNWARVKVLRTVCDRLEAELG